MITTATGSTLPLEDLAEIYYADNPQKIERKNKQYQVAVTMPVSYTHLAVYKRQILLAAVRPWHVEHRSLDQQIQYLEKKYGARIYQIHFPETALSSEEIRQAAAGGQDISSYVPAPVAAYIKAVSYTHLDVYKRQESSGGPTLFYFYTANIVLSLQSGFAGKCGTDPGKRGVHR